MRRTCSALGVSSPDARRAVLPWSDRHVSIESWHSGTMRGNLGTTRYDGFVLDRGRLVPCVVWNLSTFGALLLFEPQRLEVDEGTSIELHVQTGGRDSDITVVGEVQWINQTLSDHRGRDRLGVGLRFLSVDSHCESAIELARLAHRPTVVVVDDRPEHWNVISEALRPIAHTSFANDIYSVEALFDTKEVCTVVCGPGLMGVEAARMLRYLATEFPRHPWTGIVLAGLSQEQFQALIDDDHVFYLALSPIPVRELGDIVCGAVAHYQRCIEGPGPTEMSASDAETTRKILGALSKVEQRDTLAAVAGCVEESLLALVDGARAYCLFYEAADAVLIAASAGPEAERRVSAAAGVAGFSARTGRTVLVEETGRDPRYDSDTDDPEGSGTERLLVVPVSGTVHQVIAVLIISRYGEQPPFTERDTRSTRFLAAHLAPVFDRISLRRELDDAIERTGLTATGEAQGSFRAEAIEHYLSSASRVQGDVLRVNPVWVQRLYQITLIMAVFVGTFVTVGRVSSFATGPAVIRGEGRSIVTSATSGTITHIDVTRGQRVEVGQILAQLNDAEERANVQRFEDEFDIVLATSLRTPGDLGLRRRVGEAGLERELAHARQAQRVIKAPRAGIISDLRVRVGQFLPAGEHVGAIVDESSAFTIAALVPGRYRPQVAVGASLRLEVDGYANVYQELTIETVGDGLLGPEEVRRFLGPDVPLGVIPQDPVVVVQARLPTAHFMVDDMVFPYFDGMLGRASVRIRSERILVSLIPSLRALLRADHG